MERAGWNNHLDGMSGKRRKIPVVSGGIRRNAPVSGATPKKEVCETVRPFQSGKLQLESIRGVSGYAPVLRCNAARKSSGIGLYRAPKTSGFSFRQNAVEVR